jgi:hypothetical protein
MLVQAGQVDQATREAVEEVPSEYAARRESPQICMCRREDSCLKWPRTAAVDRREFAPLERSGQRPLRAHGERFDVEQHHGARARALEKTGARGMATAIEAEQLCLRGGVGQLAAPDDEDCFRPTARQKMYGARCTLEPTATRTHQNYRLVTASNPFELLEHAPECRVFLD